MAIKTVYKVEGEEEVPEFLKEHAVEIDGDWVVDVEDIESHPKIIKLKNAFERVKEEKKKKTEALSAAELELAKIPEDFDKEKWEELLLLADKVEDPEKQRERIRKELDKNREEVKEGLEKQWKAEKEKYEADDKKNKAFIEKIVKQDRLRGALNDVGANPKLIEGAMALLLTRIKIREDGDEFVDVVETDLGDMSTKDYVLQWIEKDEGKPYILPASGPGLKPKGKGFVPPESNPWSRGNINLTEQTRLFQENPEKARQLKEQAEKEK